MQQAYCSPGISKEELFEVPAARLRTGVPLFLGLVSWQAVQPYLLDGLSLAPLPPNDNLWLVKAAGSGALSILPEALTCWLDFEQRYGALRQDGFLAHAARGFFENGGDLCFVQIVCFAGAASPVLAVSEGLRTAAAMDTIDLVCVPDIPWLISTTLPAVDRSAVQAAQVAVLNHCDAAGDRLAILDPWPAAAPEEVLQQRRGFSSANAALYYPWVKVAGGPVQTRRFVPPCGHIAGVYARSDRRVGVHKAPANEVLEGVLDLEVALTDAQQDKLNPEGVNCLRAFPGRGIRVWGARTLSRDPAWVYVNVRRLFLTAGRWIDRHMAGVAYEPNEPRLWARISRELTTYFDSLFRHGALKGSTPQEAYYIKCDADTNPPETREAGTVITEIGLAPAVPAEFVVVRILHGASGITITGPTRPG